MNNNNYSIISSTTGISRNRLALGQQVIYGNSFIPHSHDFRNFLEHSKQVALRNTISGENKLHVMKSRHLSPNLWSDKSAVEKLNNMRMFKSDIVAYKAAILQTMDKPNFTDYFRDMKVVSEKITVDILKAVYYTDGGAGIVLIKNNLSKVVDGAFNPDVLQVYNLIIYSAPFILCNAYNNPLITPETVFNAPYELIASELQKVLYSCQFEDLSLALRVQLRLENALAHLNPACYAPDLYNSAIDFYDTRFGFRRTRYLVFKGGTTLFRLLGQPMLLTTIEGLTQQQTALVPHTAINVSPMSNEELEDLMVSLVTSIILQL